MNINRRTFLGALAAAAPLAKMIGASEAARPSIGLQLYTIRRLLEQDFEGTIKKVTGYGIKDVEFAGYYGRNPKEVRKSLDRFGLSSSSAHIDAATLRKGLERACEGARVIGQRYLVLGWLPPEERRSLDDYKRLIENLNKGAEICAKSGVFLGYHNHDFEFTEIDGKIPYHLIVTETGSMPLELDVYWAKKAGRDPLEMMKAHRGRFRLLHLKDMSAGQEKAFTEIGSGVIDFESILAQAPASGVEHCYVEQDETPGDPFDSVKKSLGYLRSIGY